MEGGEVYNKEHKKGYIDKMSQILFVHRVVHSGVHCCFEHHCSLYGQKRFFTLSFVFNKHYFVSVREHSLLRDKGDRVTVSERAHLPSE